MEREEKFIDSIATGVSVISPKMEVLWLNRTFIEWFPSIDVGKKPLCYRSFYSPPKEAICDYCPTIKTFKDGEVHSSETGVCADGNIYFVTAAPLKNEKGEVSAVIETVQNITERKKTEEALRESEKRYRRLVELSPDAIAVHSEGKIVFVNTAGAKLLGAASPEQLIGKPVIDVVHPDYRQIVKERIRKMMEERKEAPLIEEKFIKLDGSVIDVEVAAAPITYRGKPAVQVVIRDITERKKMEEALKERLAELERMHKAFVGRELKMKELKEEIKKLRERLGGK